MPRTIALWSRGLRGAGRALVLAQEGHERVAEDLRGHVERAVEREGAGRDHVLRRDGRERVLRVVRVGHGDAQHAHDRAVHEVPAGRHSEARGAKVARGLCVDVKSGERIVSVCLSVCPKQCW